MSQLSLPLEIDIKTNFLKEDFLLLPENSNALNSLKKFLNQKDFTKSKFPALILKGPKSCGKSHLLHYLSEEFGVEFLSKDDASQVNPVNFFEKNKFYILEDIENIKNEELILQLLNSAFESKAFLVLSSKINLKFKLKDLESRFKNVFLVEISNPDLDSIKQLLTNIFSRKQIKLSRRVIDFVSENIERNYEAVLAAIKLIEFYVEESGKELKIPKIREIFGKN